MPPPGMIAVLLVLILIAAISDILYRRIPNWLTISGMLSGIGLNAFLHPLWPGMKLSLLGFAAAFMVYFVLFAIRATSAGDVKLMAAIGAMVGWQDWIAIFAITAVLGGIFAVLFSIAQKRLQKTLRNVGFILGELGHGRLAYLSNEELDVTSSKGLRAPHGAIIAIGTVMFLALMSFQAE